MMICKVCGSELDDNSKFCVYCGSTLEQEVKDPADPVKSEGKPAEKPVKSEEIPAEPEFVLEDPVAPAPSGLSGLPAWIMQKLGRKGMAIAAGAVAVAAAAGVTVAAVSSLPSVKVPQAISRSVAAFSEASEKLGLNSCLDFVEKDNAYDSSIALTFEGMSEMVSYMDMSDLEGLGIRATTSFSMKDRRMSGTLAAIHDEDDLLAMNYGVDDEIVWFESEELFKGRYGMNTTSLGEDLIDMGADGMYGMEDLGFNLFDLYEMSMNMKPSEEVIKAFAEAFEALDGAVEIEDNGSDEIKVNGERIKCSAYTLTVSEDALSDFLDAIEDPMADYMDEYIEATEELYRAMGMPDEYIDEMELDSGMDAADMIDDFREVLEEVGDLEFEMYIDGGYVVAVIFEVEIDGEPMVVTMNMGGEGNYADTFSLTVEVEEYFLLELESTGNHTGKGGEFTDETEITITASGETVTISMETSYLSKEKEDNLECKLSAEHDMYGEMFGLDIKGQLNVEKKGLSLDLDKVSLESAGMEVLSVGLEYSIGKYSGADKAGDVELIPDLSEDDLMEFAEELSDNLEDWAEDLMDEFPSLQYMMFTPYSDEYSAVYYG